MLYAPSEISVRVCPPPFCTRTSKAATALVNVVANDSNLDVVREAAMTFSEMTGFRNEDLLDVNSLINWWQKNSDKVLPDLKN